VFGDSKVERIRRAHEEMLKRDHDARITAAPIFAGLSSENQQALAAAARRVQVAAGVDVIREGDTDTSAYLVWSGRVEVEERVRGSLALFAAGELVGEVAAAAGTDGYWFDRTATVHAATDVVVYEIPGDVIKRLLDDEPELRLRIRGLIEERMTTGQLRRHIHER